MRGVKSLRTPGKLPTWTLESSTYRPDLAVKQSSLRIRSKAAAVSLLKGCIKGLALHYLTVVVYGNSKLRYHPLGCTSKFNTWCDENPSVVSPTYLGRLRRKIVIAYKLDISLDSTWPYIYCCAPSGVLGPTDPLCDPL
jgi:hypothetical protein